MTKLEGVFSATCSIISQSSELDIASTIQHAKAVDKLGAGPAFLGSTSQSQLISVQEKKDLIKEVSKHKFKNEILIGTGCNSLKDTISLCRHALEFNLNNFLIGNVSYYKNDDVGVFDFFSRIVKEVKTARIVLYSFERLMHYKFSAEVVKKLKKEYPDNFIGLKDSSLNLWDNLKLPDFSIFVGNEAKLLSGLEKGCIQGVISATCNCQPYEIRKVYDDFKNNKLDLSINDKIVKVRDAFDQSGSLIGAVHTFLSQKDERFKRLLPPLALLSKEKEQELLKKLEKLNFIPKNIAA